MQRTGHSLASLTDSPLQSFPSRTEGSVKKHWYKDMHYAEFAEDEVRQLLPAACQRESGIDQGIQSQALLNAIKEYENNKWKVIGQKVGKPAKACEQHAKEHFPGMPPIVRGFVDVR